MPRELEGKVAVVTGASKGGIGTALAERFAAEGAKVAVATRTRKGLEEAVALVEDAGSTGALYIVDLSRPDGGRATLIDEVERDLGPVDILVNNSALGGFKPFDDWTMEQLQKVQEVNNWSPWMLTQRVLPGMRERGSGAVLNVSSQSAEVPLGPPFSHAAPARGLGVRLHEGDAEPVDGEPGRGDTRTGDPGERAVATESRGHRVARRQRVVPRRLLRTARHDGRGRDGTRRR